MTIVVRKDPIGKVRVLIEYLNEKFLKYYSPGEYLSIDEGMIPFMGKVKFKIYNPDKPNKWGIKEYVLCDAKSAYTLENRLFYGTIDDDEVVLSKT